MTRMISIMMNMMVIMIIFNSNHDKNENKNKVENTTVLAPLLVTNHVLVSISVTSMPFFLFVSLILLYSVFLHSVSGSTII